MSEAEHILYLYLFKAATMKCSWLWMLWSGHPRSKALLNAERYEWEHIWPPSCSSRLIPLLPSGFSVFLALGFGQTNRPKGRILWSSDAVLHCGRPAAQQHPHTGGGRAVRSGYLGWAVDTGFAPLRFQQCCLLNCIPTWNPPNSSIWKDGDRFENWDANSSQGSAVSFWGGCCFIRKRVVLEVRREHSIACTVGDHYFHKVNLAPREQCWGTNKSSKQHQITKYIYTRQLLANCNQLVKAPD